jgi:hypothetical protein
MGKKGQERILEEAADEFLTTHDPFYRDKRRNKGRRVSYPYLTKQQLDEVRNREIPFSSLGDNQAAQCASHNCDVSNYREAKNNE